MQAGNRPPSRLAEPRGVCSCSRLVNLHAGTHPCSHGGLWGERLLDVVMHLMLSKVASLDQSGHKMQPGTAATSVASKEPQEQLKENSHECQSSLCTYTACTAYVAPGGC